MVFRFWAPCFVAGVGALSRQRGLFPLQPFLEHPDASAHPGCRSSHRRALRKDHAGQWTNDAFESLDFDFPPLEISFFALLENAEQAIRQITRSVPITSSAATA